MMIKRVLAIAVLAGSLGVGALHAQIREQQPAEFPPASYKGKQYVDSRGCVFIRAGIDGNVAWIPRVTRARKTVCGFQPSLAGQVASAPEPTAAVAPAEIAVNTAPVAKPAPQRVTKPRRTAPVVVRQTAPKRRVATRPVAVAPAPQVVTTVRRGQVQTSCPGASALSGQYLRGNGKDAVRCGPQGAAIIGSGNVVSGVQIAAAPSQYRTETEVTAHTRIVPKHVAHNRINTRAVTVPKGYKSVWEDGRLNPYRAEQSLAGRNQMLLVWTQTVPRRLIDTKTGRDVTTSVPLIYPYIDIFTQSKELGQVTIVQRDGQIAKRVIRNPGVRKPVYSSRSKPKAATRKSTVAAKPRALAGKRYVQIGTFGKPANAQQSAQNIARMGYPARIGKHRKGGRSYLTVQAGPFNDAAALQSAINKLRGAGYTDAFARN
ncbi:MAG: SPOR domain-containing protein [Sulfitobacter sp.]